MIKWRHAEYREVIEEYLLWSAHDLSALRMRRQFSLSAPQWPEAYFKDDAQVLQDMSLSFLEWLSQNLVIKPVNMAPPCGETWRWQFREASFQSDGAGDDPQTKMGTTAKTQCAKFEKKMYSRRLKVVIVIRFFLQVPELRVSVLLLIREIGFSFLINLN